MSLTDPISNCLTIIRNGIQANKETVDVPASRLIERTLKIFKEDGYIEDYRAMQATAQGAFKVYLKYNGKTPSIMGIRRISKPGLRVYKNSQELPRVLNGLGTAVISTSKGIMSDREAKKQKVGGEVLCYIW